MGRFKLVLGLVAALFTVVAAGPAQARSKAKLGVAGAFVLPVGDWSDAYSAGLGALLTVDYGLTDKAQLTGRIGYLQFLGKEIDAGLAKVDVPNFGMIPVFVGIKYFAIKSLYLGAEAGPSITLPDEGDSDTNIGLTLGAGYMLKDVDIRGFLMMSDIGHAGDTMSLGLTVGYRFTAL